MTDVHAPIDVAPTEPIFGSLVDAFVASFAIIVCSEIGDKTFFIAAILSMRENPWVVYTGAIGALAVMTVLSVLCGWLVPTLLSKTVAHYAFVLLFFIFGVRLLYSATRMEGGISDELEEVEQELYGGTEEKKDEKTLVAKAAYTPVGKIDGGELDEEGALGTSAEGLDVETSTTIDGSLEVVPETGVAAAPGEEAGLVIDDGAEVKPPPSAEVLTGWGLFVKSFAMTFLAEWGDRSQVATIALGAEKNAFGVTVGAIMGHALCTGFACVGGKMLATQISERTVTYAGGVLFLVFSVTTAIFDG
jgi:putative Ca2+/H+ antiporter (TMEM165/GDT1 family)